ncbi:hypothetical protein CKF58_02275 [Psittacicella hinzii]|uniref:Uncharacterized protein n=2 Tax=Psittacicella hinzii TaxID=2028575 RepID=A0A3A1YM62_9GAMM|nr:hypothetical protein CKF58_02275 [Psittacicella hinzii]
MRDCYFAISRDNMHLLSEAMLPENAIFIDDVVNLLAPCQEDFDCYRYTACMQHVIKRITQAIGALEFNLFTPGINTFLTYGLASSPLCKSLHFIEQGQESYYRPITRAYNFKQADIANKYSQFFVANPDFVAPNTGVQDFMPLTAYNVEGLHNNNLNPEKVQFFRLNRQAFKHVEQQNRAALEHLPEEQREALQLKFTTFDLEQVKHFVYTGPLLPVAQQYQENLDMFQVLAVDPLYYDHPGEPTAEDYQVYRNHIKSLIARIQHQQNIELLFVRFAKGQSQKEKDLVTEILDQTDFYFLVLEDDFNLELEFALAPTNQFLVHGISSELLIYAQTFQQSVCEYVDLVVHDQQWNNYLSNRGYFIKSILFELSSDLNDNDSVPYRHVFVVTSEIALATSLTLIKQFDLSTDQCFMLTDRKNYPKVSAIFNEAQVMMYDDFEIIYEHVNTQRRVIHYLDAATYVNGMINKFIGYYNYSLYTDSMDSYLSMQLASHFRCKEANLIESGVASAQINNDFGITKAHEFCATLYNKFPQQLPAGAATLTPHVISYCFRLRKYAFTQPVIRKPMMLINLQVKQLRELNLYNQVIAPVDGAERIHLLVIENNQMDYPFVQQYLADYASVLKSLEDRNLGHLYIMLIHPNINIFNQLKNFIIATGIPSFLFYNIDLFSELFYANKQVRVHTMSPKIAALAQFSQQAFTLYHNSIPVSEHEELPNLKLRTTLTDVIISDLDNLGKASQ